MRRSIVSEGGGCFTIQIQTGVSPRESRPIQGAGVLLGDEDRPLPNMLGTTMKYFSGLRVMSGPMSQSFSQCLPARRSICSTSAAESQIDLLLGKEERANRMLTCKPGGIDYSIALVSVQGAPALYAIFALGRVSPLTS